MSTLSPLRYPGGKGKLAPFISNLIQLNDLEGGSYFEPFAGGAGVALHLLFEGDVKRIVLNDADPCIYAFWDSIMRFTDEFVRLVELTPLNVEEFRKQSEICQRSDEFDGLELGFAVFYINRCSRSGIIGSAGPIGGYDQSGKWLIDARFNREGLIERIEKIATKSEQIEIHNLDALNFLKTQLPKGRGRSNSLVYLDPPYHLNGHRLYLNYYDDSDHESLADYIKAQNALKWLITYDTSEFIKELYAEYDIHEFKLNYSLQNKKKAEEFMISPATINLPVSRNWILTEVC